MTHTAHRAVGPGTHQTHNKPTRSTAHTCLDRIDYCSTGRFLWLSHRGNLSRRGSALSGTPSRSPWRSKNTSTTKNSTKRKHSESVRTKIDCTLCGSCPFLRAYAHVNVRHHAPCCLTACGGIVVTAGHPRPPLSGPSVPWVSVLGPNGVTTHPGRMMGHQSANPLCGWCCAVMASWGCQWCV